jgi:hypothetical protein
MFINSSKIIRIYLFILLSISSITVFASQESQTDSEPALDGGSNRQTLKLNPLSTEKGMINLDYEVIQIPGNKSIDLLGVHYLHQLNSWLYLGFGLHTPIASGNYGGFMAFDGTVHAQRTVYRNWFVDAGVSLGGGGGGETNEQSKELTGSGGFIKSYLGMGYEFQNFSVGVNYADVRFRNSQINHSQLNLIVQKPFSYSIGSYAYAGKKIEFDSTFPEFGANIFTLENNNIFQLKPAGSNKNTISSISLQFSHYLTNTHYLFVGGDIGYKGLPIYNQVVGGVGYKFLVSPSVNFYGQIGIGSGGYAADQIDTGPGLLVYPKFSVEYLLSNNLGLSLSGGYLRAPKGTSSNFTLGAGLNYQLSTNQKGVGNFISVDDRVFRGLRFSVFPQTEFNVRVGSKNIDNLNLLSTQFDYIVNDNWYWATQGSVAYNTFFGYPGYGEILTGLGIQNIFSATNKFQSFFQILAGANVMDTLIKPSVGINYSLSDNLALYSQLSKTKSMNKTVSGNTKFSSNSIGLGLTYRFSLP